MVNDVHRMLTDRGWLWLEHVRAINGYGLNGVIMIFIFIFTIVKMVMFTESGLRNHNPYSLPVLWINSQLDNDTF